MQSDRQKATLDIFDEFLLVVHFEVYFVEAFVESFSLLDFLEGFVDGEHHGLLQEFVLHVLVARQHFFSFLSHLDHFQLVVVVGVVCDGGDVLFLDEENGLAVEVVLGGGFFQNGAELILLRDVVGVFSAVSSSLQLDLVLELLELCEEAVVRGQEACALDRPTLAKRKAEIHQFDRRSGLLVSVVEDSQVDDCDNQQSDGLGDLDLELLRASSFEAELELGLEQEIHLVSE